MKYPYFALVVCVVLVGFGCGDNGAGSGGIGAIVPLKVGNEWSGTWMIDTTGTPTEFGTMTFSVDSIYTVENEMTYNVRICKTLAPDPTPLCLFCPYVNRPDGFYMFCWGSPEMMYKYPASAGDSYPFPREFFVSDSSGTATVMSIDTSITVPQGTYECYHYRVSEPFERNYYVAPNVGWVKWEFLADGGSLVWELESLTLR